MEVQHKDIIAFSRSFQTSLLDPVLSHRFLRANRYKKPIHKIEATRFLSVQSQLDLARLLIISLEELEQVINIPAYHVFRLNKKSGGQRTIHAPAEELKRLQKRINFFLQSFYLWIKPPVTFGFVINPKYLQKKCHIVENARLHAGQKHLLNLDIADFFQSITAGRVKACFMSTYFQFPEQVAVALALLATYQGKLPVGAPSSPAISNFVCIDMDHDLQALSLERQWTYSRYADDLSFSSDRPFEDSDIKTIRETIEGHQFTLNTRKARLSGSNRKQKVTGLVVNEKVNVDRKFIRKTRAMLHDLSENGLHQAAVHHFGEESGSTIIHQHMFINRLHGYINFIGQVRGRNDALYMRLNQGLIRSLCQQELYSCINPFMKE